MSQLFASGGRSIGVSASTSVLSMNTQDRVPQNNRIPSLSNFLECQLLTDRKCFHMFFNVLESLVVFNLY